MVFTEVYILELSIVAAAVDHCIHAVTATQASCAWRVSGEHILLVLRTSSIYILRIYVCVQLS